MRTLLNFFIFFALSGPALAQFPNGYIAERPIRIDHRMVPGTLTNFPMLISGTYSYLANVANGGKVQNSNGYDIVFTSDSGGSSYLSWEVESYNPSTGAIVAWVKVPTVSSSVDTVIYMFYGNAGINVPQSAGKPWDSSYKAVWHLGSPSGLSLTDATGNGHTLSNNGGASAGPGQIGGAANLANIAYLDAGTSADFDTGNGNATMEIWANPSGDQPLSTALLSRGDSTGGHYVYIPPDNYLFWSVNGTMLINASAKLTTNTWNHVVAVKSGTSYCLYRNGSSFCVTGPAQIGSGYSFWIGNLASDVPRRFNGLVDEVRYSNVARSAEWIMAEYNNQQSPDLFYSVGSEVGAIPTMSCPADGLLAMVGFPFSTTMVVSGGVQPFSFAISSGAIPPGTTLDQFTATISGTPLTASTYNFTMQLTDASTHRTSASCAIQVKPTEPLAPRTFGNATSGWHWYGPKTVIAGRDTWYTFSPRWSFPVTCDVASQRCDSHGTYAPTGNEGLVWISSTGTPPTGLWDIYGNQQATYRICDISGTSFTLREAGGTLPGTCGGKVQPFTDTGTGLLYVQLDSSYPQTIWVSAVTGLPNGATVSWYRTDHLIQNIPKGPAPTDICCGGWDLPMMQLTVPPDATPGSYTVNITFAADAGGTLGTVLSFPIEVVALQPLSLAKEPETYPAIPGLATWETRMLSGVFQGNTGGGPAWCDKSTGQSFPDPLSISAYGESQAWYYDGARVYRQIADYTGDSNWGKCASNYARQYVETVLPIRSMYPDGYKGVSPWPLFSRGIALEADSNDHRFQETVEYQTRTYHPESGYAIPGFNQLRPQALQLDAYLDYERILGFPRPLLTSKLASFIMQELLSLTDDQNRPAGDQPFYIGLAMEALISYWDATRDPLVPYTIKRTLDYLWAHYDATNWHSFMYNTAPPGPGCSCPNYTCPQNVDWFVTDPTHICNSTADTNRFSAQVLNNLISPGFAWYWRISGDDTYLEGDDAFAHALDNPDSLSTGKMFSQEYHWSFDFVRWRSGR